MKELEFIKMQSLGNDFVMLDGVSEHIRISESIARKIADRHFGIGCDQIILAEPGTDGSELRMRIFNTDGSEVGQCGNGARCFAAFVRDKGLAASDHIQVQTSTTHLTLEIESEQRVSVGMGRPCFEPSEIPLRVPAASDLYAFSHAGCGYEFAAMSLGNPHCTFLVDDVDHAPLEEIGPILQNHTLFPERVNAGFAQVVSRTEIRLRAYERGVGETLGCGSGACAAAVLLMRQGKLDDQVSVQLPGGSVDVSWCGQQGEVVLAGPVSYVFEGVFKIAPMSGVA